MCKVWVVSHHLLTKVCTQMALVDLSISKRMISLKSAARMLALVSVVRTLYHATTLLVLPQHKNGGEIYERMKRRCYICIWMRNK